MGTKRMPQAKTKRNEPGAPASVKLRLIQPAAIDAAIKAQGIHGVTLDAFVTELAAVAASIGYKVTKSVFFRTKTGAWDPSLQTAVTPMDVAKAIKTIPLDSVTRWKGVLDIILTSLKDQYPGFHLSAVEVKKDYRQGQATGTIWCQKEANVTLEQLRASDGLSSDYSTEILFFEYSTPQDDPHSGVPGVRLRQPDSFVFGLGSKFSRDDLDNEITNALPGKAKLSQFGENIYYFPVDPGQEFYAHNGVIAKGKEVGFKRVPMAQIQYWRDAAGKLHKIPPPAAPPSAALPPAAASPGKQEDS